VTAKKTQIILTCEVINVTHSPRRIGQRWCFSEKRRRGIGERGSCYWLIYMKSKASTVELRHILLNY